MTTLQSPTVRTTGKRQEGGAWFMVLECGHNYRWGIREPSLERTKYVPCDKCRLAAVMKTREVSS